MKPTEKPHSRRQPRVHEGEKDHVSEPPDLDRESAEPSAEPDEPTDLDSSDIDPDDRHWDVFLFDDDRDRDPLPETGDFWLPD